MRLRISFSEPLELGKWLQRGWKGVGEALEGEWVGASSISYP